MDENMRMNYSEKIQTHLSAWPRKLTSVMEIHRQGFSQLNPRFKQQTTGIKPVQQPAPMGPANVPLASRPQPRQQARLKPSTDTLPTQQPIRRSTTAQNKRQQILSDGNNQYLTLANLTKLLHVLQTQEKISDHETSTDTSTSTTNSAKQRVQQHLQQTATRWWKASRSSDCPSTVPTSSSIHAYAKSAAPVELDSIDVPLTQPKESDNLPLLVKKSFFLFKISSSSSFRQSFPIQLDIYIYLQPVPMLHRNTTNRNHRRKFKQLSHRLFHCRSRRIANVLYQNHC